MHLLGLQKMRFLVLLRWQNALCYDVVGQVGERFAYCGTHCGSQTSGQDDVAQNHYGAHDRACDGSVGDDDAPFDKNR